MLQQHIALDREDHRVGAAQRDLLREKQLVARVGRKEADDRQVFAVDGAEDAGQRDVG